MAKKNNQKIMWAILVVGVLGFMWWRNRKKSQSAPQGVSEAKDPNLEYAKQKFGVSDVDADTIMNYIETKIKPSKKWMQGIDKRAKKHKRTTDVQLIHDAYYQLYTKLKKQGKKPKIKKG